MRRVERSVVLRTSAGAQHRALVDSPFARVPEDVIEHVLLHLTPYGDLQACAQVSQLFYRLANDARDRLCRLFSRATAFDWYLLQLPDESSTRCKKFAWNIAERCSHSAVYHERRRCIYVFGGCTANYTAFNDLLCFDLHTRSWTRPLPLGGPTPKACATLVVLDDGRLLLYGGWSKSSPNPIHHQTLFFNEMHVFDPELNRWDRLLDEGSTQHPSLAGHSACMRGNVMLVFGGSSGHLSSNDVRLYDTKENVWRMVGNSRVHKMSQAPIADTAPRPTPRYGQSQILLDLTHVLIVGGCGGPNIIHNDVWLLTISDDPTVEWFWQQVHVVNPSMMAPAIWSHPGCRVGDNFVCVSKPMPRASPASSPRLSTNEHDHLESRPSSSGSLTPPRRKLLTSRSLDEHDPPTTATLAAPSMGRCAELHRASSIPAIIVGEIPTLVVSDDSTSAQPTTAATPPITVLHSSMLPNHGTVVEPEPPNVVVDDQPSTSRGVTNAISSDRAHPSVRPNAQADRQRQLEMLRRAEEHIRSSRQSASRSASGSRGRVETGQISRPTFRPNSPPPPSQRRHSSASSVESLSTNPMTLYVMSLETVLTSHTVTWRAVESPADAPEDTILYSLTAADGEMVMFGGMRTRQPHEPAPQLHPGGSRGQQNALSNETYVLRPVIEL